MANSISCEQARQGKVQNTTLPVHFLTHSLVLTERFGVLKKKGVSETELSPLVVLISALLHDVNKY